MEIGAASKKRDKVLRAKLLMALYLSRISFTGGISARELLNYVQNIMPPRQGFTDDEHALSLMRDLCRIGAAEERKLGERRRGQRFTLDWIELAITHKGILLHEQQIPPDPLVDDDRQLDE